MLAQTWTFLLNEALPEAVGLSLDFLVFFGIAALFFGYVLYRGKERGLALLLGLYGAGLFFFLFPYQDLLYGLEGPVKSGEKEALYIRIGIFFSILFFLKVVFGQFLHSSFSENQLHKMIDGVLLTFFISGVFFSYAEVFLSFSELYTPEAPLDWFIQVLFKPESSAFWWTLSSFVYLYLSTKKY